MNIKNLLRRLIIWYKLNNIKDTLKTALELNADIKVILLVSIEKPFNDKTQIINSTIESFKLKKEEILTILNIGENNVSNSYIQKR